MISRVAEHCYWLASYLERAENTARVLEVNHTLLLDFHVPVEQQWRPVLIISGIHDLAAPATAEAVQGLMTWDPDNPSKAVVFVDCGMTPYNNPAFLLHRMATEPAYKLNWRRGEKNLLLVSVGTGAAE